MRIAVLADIHSNHIALDTCLKEAQRQRAEAFLFLGDYLGELAYPEKTLALLEDISRQYPCTFIRGNKEDYWIDHQKGEHGGWHWQAGSSSTGMLDYVYSRLTAAQISAFERMPIAKRMEYAGLPAFVICHGSPWKANQSLREDGADIDQITQRLETELTICGHFHIQCEYRRNGRRVVNPGAVGVPLKSSGKAQFMMLSSTSDQWDIRFITLPYDREKAIREMDEEKLYAQAPGWYRVTKEVLRKGEASHLTMLSKARELYAQDTGSKDWRIIPEQYWNMALTALGIPE